MPDKTLAESLMSRQTFNEVVHEQTENGDPHRNEDGSIRLKKNWKKVAVDRQGRTFNPRIHEADHALDDEGYLRVQRRGVKPPMAETNRTQDFVAKHKEPGYAYRVVNDEGGRINMFEQHDWEPVVGKDGVASINVGQARRPDTTAILMRKPEEWFEEDQRQKRAKNELRFKQTTSPKEEDGQYEANPTSPLR